MNNGFTTQTYNICSDSSTSDSIYGSGILRISGTCSCEPSYSSSSRNLPERGRTFREGSRLRTGICDERHIPDSSQRHSTRPLHASTRHNDTRRRNPFIPSPTNDIDLDEQQVLELSGAHYESERSGSHIPYACYTNSAETHRGIRREAYGRIFTSDEPSQNGRTSTRNTFRINTPRGHQHSDPTGCTSSTRGISRGVRVDQGSFRRGHSSVYDQPYLPSTTRRNNVATYRNAGSFPSTFFNGAHDFNINGVAFRSTSPTYRTENALSEFPTSNLPPPPPTYSERLTDRLVHISSSSESRPLPPSYAEVWEQN